MNEITNRFYWQMQAINTWHVKNKPTLQDPQNAHYQAYILKYNHISTETIERICREFPDIKPELERISDSMRLNAV